ncbi:MAG: DUF2157 domain-containing protein [Candidatus Paceibacterota bacterium]
MEKLQVMSFIQSQLDAGTITNSDILSIATGSVAQAAMPVTTTSTVAPQIGHSQRNLVNIFYVIGAIIILTGVIILVSQHWKGIGFPGRVLVTAGIAIGSYVAGLMLRSPSSRVLSQVFFTISVALAPLGAYVILTENGMSFGLVEQIIIAVGLTMLFAFAWLITRRNVLTLFVVFNLTWAYYAAVIKVLNNGAAFGSDILSWATIIAGIAYILVGYGYKGISNEISEDRERRSVQTILYGLGTLAVLSAGFSLNGIWDLVYIPVLFAAFYLSVFLRSRAMLIFAAIFLIAHLVYLTSKYFVDVTGWPIALIICGFIVIGIGYGSLYVMKKYIK